MQKNVKLTPIEKFRIRRETRFGLFVPVLLMLLALVAIWLYFGIREPAFMSARNFSFLFMQSAILSALAVGITVVLLLGWVTTSTPFGWALFAVGGNAESARRVGMNVQRIRVAAFGLVGMMAAIGGIVGASRYAPRRRH